MSLPTHRSVYCSVLVYKWQGHPVVKKSDIPQAVKDQMEGWVGSQPWVSGDPGNETGYIFCWDFLLFEERAKSKAFGVIE